MQRIRIREKRIPRIRAERSRAREDSELNGRSTRERATLPSAAPLLAGSAANGVSEGHRPRHTHPQIRPRLPQSSANGAELSSHETLSS